MVPDSTLTSTINCSYALIQHWLTTLIYHLQQNAEGKCDQQPISGK